MMIAFHFQYKSNNHLFVDLYPLVILTKIDEIVELDDVSKTFHSSVISEKVRNTFFIKTFIKISIF